MLRDAEDHPFLNDISKTPPVWENHAPGFLQGFRSEGFRLL